MRITGFLFVMILLVAISSFQSCAKKQKTVAETILIEAESFKLTNAAVTTENIISENKVISINSKIQWLTYDVNVITPGRYRCDVSVKSYSSQPSLVWIEDYYDNKDGRTYNITIRMNVLPSNGNPSYTNITTIGCPLNTGLHKMKLHINGDSLQIDWIKFTLIKKHQITPVALTQSTEGKDWKLAWSDEFEGEGLPDTSKWTFDFGNWGWGNNEPQYYTEFRTENARQENGNLIIEARKNDMDQPWTSARLTTRGKISFIYGKFEFRAKVPAGDGTWAAGWFLGDAYRDELSWPYCGEIDVLETVGHEIDDESGIGINHASCHTRSYYFKEGTHLTSTIEVQNMTDEYHIYAIEWTPKGIEAFLDGKLYYTYDKINGELEWPFSNPQNIIINLAMGGGMGGPIDASLESQKLIVDYIRLYERH